ncbi:hypothetical protein [Mycobacterium camsae]|uniref:hypothetical protein n=1 Tax=Mycobacterium gordonae TaxID=1778 RepID=UPI00197DD59F|nr:hypothetical protein [Mycobacterium gordonae]
MRIKRGMVHDAESWLDAQAAAVGNGGLKVATAAKYKRLLGVLCVAGAGRYAGCGDQRGPVPEVPRRARQPPIRRPRRTEPESPRTKERKGGGWGTGTLKSSKSRRTVPLPGWLAEKMDCHLAGMHPRGSDDTAPLRPGRSADVIAHVAKRRRAAHGWDEPVDMPTFYRRVFRPAHRGGAHGERTSHPRNGSRAR